MPRSALTPKKAVDLAQGANPGPSRIRRDPHHPGKFKRPSEARVRITETFSIAIGIAAFAIALIITLVGVLIWIL